MAYYTIIPNNTGTPSNPGFMQNVVALANVMGKGINSSIYKDAAAQNSLIPEYDVDSESGDVKTSYKSPYLVNRGIFAPGAPGNPDGKPSAPQKTSQIIQDALAQAAVKNAQDQVPSGEDTSQPGWSLSDGQAPSNTAPQDGPLPTDHSQIFQDALMQQANQNPLMAKSLGVAPSNPKPQKETLDSAIADAQSGNQTWAEVINKYPTKIKQIQQAKKGLSAYQAATAAQPTQAASTPATKGPVPAGATQYSPSLNKYYDAQGNEVS